MSEKEYPMDENYNQALKFLIEQIAEREQLSEQLKHLSPADRPEGLRLLAELDKAIERGEQALAKEYESFQNLRRLEEERDKEFDEAAEMMAGSYVHIKYRNPEMLEEMEEIINKMQPEEAEDFYARAKRLEAGDLIRIIAREGETREQTEAFLEDYRLEKEKKKDAMLDEIVDRMAMVFIHIKYRHPEKLEEMRAAATNDYTPEEEKDFYDRVKRFEADDLIGLIAQQGETREQTEEFLRNYRAAETKEK